MKAVGAGVFLLVKKTVGLNCYANGCFGLNVDIKVIDSWFFIRKAYVALSKKDSFSTCRTFSKKLTFLTPWYAHVRNVSFSENFVYVINEWSQIKFDTVLKTVLICFKIWNYPQQMWCTAALNTH